MSITQLSDGTPDGTVIGQSASSKISFYGATTVVRQATAAAGTDAATTQTLANALRTAMLNYGLIG
jgi:hypothetical protein